MLHMSSQTVDHGNNGEEWEEEYIEYKGCG